MRTAPASLFCLLLGVALIVAPLAAVDASLPVNGALADDACCGHCTATESSDSATTGHTCCATPDGDDPASSQPCDSDCGQCPCCAVTAPVLLAVLAPETESLEPAHSTGLLTADALLSSRSDEPLLPPPRG